MRANGSISMRQDWHPDPLGDGGGYYTRWPVEWHGGPIAEIDLLEYERIARGIAARPGAIVRWGRWRLAVVATTPLYSYPRVYVTRDLRWAWWYALRWRVDEHAAWLKVRLIATAAIWGLGRYDWSADPSWDEIHAVAWMKRKWHAIRH